MIAAQLAALALLLTGSAFFSISEISLFSLRPWRVDRIRRENAAVGEAISWLISDPLRLLVTIVVGNEVLTMVGGNVMAIIRRQYLSEWGGAGVVAAMFATSALFLIFGEITPKAVAASFPEWFASVISRPLKWLARLLAPLARPLAWLMSRLPASEDRRHAQGVLSEADFRMVVEMGLRDGVLKRREVDMIGAVFRLGETPVRSVMVPRTDLVAISADATPAAALRVVRRFRHSRIPVFQGELDQIRGILYAKDLLRPEGAGPGPASVGALARPAYFVPEAMKARQLLREFQTRHLHMAIVVDEYGGTAGLVSLEDLLEEIVGEIEDDFDRPEQEYRKIRDGIHWARGSFPFTDFKRQVRARARAGDYDTLGGYVLKLFGRFPEEGERISDGQYTYTVTRAGGRRIIELIIQRSAAKRKSPGRTPGLPR